MQKSSLMLLMCTVLAIGNLFGANTEIVDGISWTYTISQGKASLYADGYGVKAIPDSTTGAITIPATLGGYPVESIGRGAFYGCKFITAVIIPNTVADIGGQAFASCSDLANVTIPNSVTNVGWEAFFACKSLSAIEIPEGVRSIGDRAFQKCYGLTAVTIPDSIESISMTAFDSCDKLWTNWYRALANLAAKVDSASDGDSDKSVSLITTNIVIHYVMQSVPSSAVIPPMATGFVNVVTEVGASNAVAISSEWAGQYPGFTDKFGSDFGTAITKQSGKRDDAGNPMFVWQDFVAGTDPTDETDVFRASITFDAITGDPVISWSPELSAAEAAKRTYRIFGKVRLNDSNWTLVDGNAADYNFFKVSVEMK